MSDRPQDPRWPKLLSLSVHEFRTPVTVVAGYIRMLLKDRAGPLNDQQRRLLEEAEKSCARLSGLLVEMSELGALEGRTAPFNRGSQDLAALLQEVVDGLPQMQDRVVAVRLERHDAAVPVTGDANRLRSALTSVLLALRRELVTSTELIVRLATRTTSRGPTAWVAVGDAEHIDAYATAEPSALTTFDEWRGGVGLSLAVARRILNEHEGSIWSPADGSRAGAVLSLPLASD